MSAEIRNGGAGAANRGCSRVVIEPFLLYSKSAELYLYYILGLQFARKPQQQQQQQQFLRVPELRVCVHESAVTSLTFEYSNSGGGGVCLPWIVHRGEDSAPGSSAFFDDIEAPQRNSGTAAAVAASGPCRDIDAVRDAIVRVCRGDRSLETRATCIAQYLVHSKGLDRGAIVRQLEQRPQHALRCIERLLECESGVLSSTPQAIGPDLTTFLLAGSIQKSLNVKRIEPAAATAAAVTTEQQQQQQQRIVPNIKTVMLHNHPTHVWVRFRLPGPIDDATRAHNVVHISDNVYELYMRKRGKQCRQALAVIVHLEETLRADIVFCSELALLAYDPLLFLSNYLKFMYCYARDAPIFDPRTHSDMRHVSMFLTAGQLFLNTNNLTAMPSETHNPLIAYTGERPKLALSKCSRDATFNVEGSRAMQSIDMISDFGAKSNLAEVIMEVDVQRRGIDALGLAIL